MNAAFARSPRSSFRASSTVRHAPVLFETHNGAPQPLLSDAIRGTRCSMNLLLYIAKRSSGGAGPRWPRGRFPRPPEAEIDHGVPVFLDQLRDALGLGQITSPEINRSAIKHGHDLLRQGFTVSQVVHDYGDVCQAITELAVEVNAPISTDDFRTLNRCLDDAIAGAVTQYGRERNQSGIDGESARGSERLGFFAHELRNLMNTAIMAFEVLKTGNVGVAGSTGTVLHRSLMASHTLITRSLAEVRLTQSIQNPEQFAVAAFIDEIASASTLEAHARGVRL